MQDNKTACYDHVLMVEPPSNNMFTHLISCVGTSEGS